MICRPGTAASARARRWLAAALLAAVAAGCAPKASRSVLPPAPAVADGTRTLVVGVDRDGANRYPAAVLARELAFALSQRGRIAADLAVFLTTTGALGRPVPDAYRERLQSGVVDPELAGYLQTEGVQSLIFLEVPISEQEWTSSGKRTRLGLVARGHDLTGREPSWQASTAPEVEGEPGRGFQLAMEAGLGALVRAINREPAPFAPPRPLAPLLDTLKWW